MAKINIDIAYLHGTFILGGKNFGPTIEKKKITGLELFWDQIEKELWVAYNGITGFAPSSMVSFCIPQVLQTIKTAEDAMDLSHGIAEVQARVKGKGKAQVSSPMGHVFEGPGAGKTGQEKK